MKYHVSKIGAKVTLIPAVLYNMILIGIIIFALIDSRNQKEAIYAALLFILFFIGNNIYVLYNLALCLPSVTFEKDAVRCSFMKKTKIIIPYSEIAEYDVVWLRGYFYIYISRTKLNMDDDQIQSEIFELYKKTKDVIVFDYHEEAIDFLNKVTQKQINSRQCM